MDCTDFVDLYLDGYPPQKGLEKHPHGWRKAAMEHIAEALGIGVLTVKNWGSHLENTPQWAQESLAKEHKLRQIRILMQ